MKINKKMSALTLAFLTSTMMLNVPVFAQEVQTQTIAESEEWIEESDIVISNRDPNSPADLTQASGVGVFRLYNPNSGEHFYTADRNEKDGLIAAGWDFEGIGWYAPESSNYPVHRLYNENAGDHHYTTDQNEVNVLQSVGWKLEGVGWYSADASQQSVPIYRQYNPNAKTGSHNYTSDANENKQLGQLGWKLEGIGWYGLAVDAPTQNVAYELEKLATDYRNSLLQQKGELTMDSLLEKGNELTTLINSLSKQFGNRVFLFQNGRLVGYSNVNETTILTQDMQPGSVLAFYPARKRIQLAAGINNNRLDGAALYYRTQTGRVKIQAVAGVVVDSSFQGDTTSYLYSEDPSNAYEEMTVGNAAQNLMHGKILKHTHYFRAASERIMDFKWDMEVENGNAKYEKIGNYYYVCHTDTINVFYDTPPTNLVFWPRSEI
ncbi:hypothetical protein [Allobaculum stercoricanis]|uniref:hypothetical protein n=1 Tax=Allobaculum stercoricanis TaxID=174709 RepID=UPI000374C218|nr:hypothetical protein [Allobaculum stercoricanis]